MTSLPPSAIPPQSAPDAVEHVEYHRLNLARSRRPRWWRPVLVAVLGGTLYVAMLIVLMVPLFVAAMLVPEVGESLMGVTADFAMNLNDPITFALAMASIILMLPALLIASRIVAGRGLGLLSSVAGRLRRAWLLRCLAASAGVFVVMTGVQIGVAALIGDEVVVGEGAFSVWPMLVLAIVLVPLQAATEEYVFRGFLMQAIGSWLRHPAFAILLPLPLFVFGHLYDIWGLLSVGVFALAAGWLTWRTGGLEAAIALHIVNNIGVFALAALNLADANSSGGGPLDLLWSALSLAVSAAVLELLWRRAGLARTLRWPGAPRTLPPVLPPDARPQE